jgi:prepilin-type N-terminal cleavage/methylation domain-containing protein
MKKGFTLIEMLAVVLIISLIALISLPTITNQLVDKKQEISETTMELINNATGLYMETRIGTYPKVTGQKYCVSLDTLVSNGYLSSPIKDFSNGSEIPLTKYVVVTVNKYQEYVYDDDLSDESC